MLQFVLGRRCQRKGLDRVALAARLLDWSLRVSSHRCRRRRRRHLALPVKILIAAAR